MTIEEVQKAIMEVEAGAACSRTFCENEVSSVGGADTHFRNEVDNDVFERDMRNRPIFRATALLSYIANDDITLELVLGKRLFSRGLKGCDVRSGGTYRDNLKFIGSPRVTDGSSTLPRSSRSHQPQWITRSSLWRSGTTAPTPTCYFCRSALTARQSWNRFWEESWCLR